MHHTSTRLLAPDNRRSEALRATAPFSAAPVLASPPFQPVEDRVVVDGKLFRLGGRSWYIKGLTYGPFPRNGQGEHLPELAVLQRDFRQIRALGANCLRLYHPPGKRVLDESLAQDLRVMIDVPWEKHRCFFEDYSAQRDARSAVADAAREFGAHPGLFALSVGNEIPHDIVRFYGAKRIRRFIDDLLDTARQIAPQCLLTYTNYPSTEFLEPARLDFRCFNLYLEDASKFGDYLERLQHLAGPLPLVLGEFGVDAYRHGLDGQANLLVHQVQQVYRKGLAGGFVFSYTDDWFTGGAHVEGWAFGISNADRESKPAARALSVAWSGDVSPRPAPAPRVSVVVCTYNGARTLTECLTALGNLDYPDYEVIVVDDGSSDATPEITSRFAWIKSIRQTNRGLSAARNAGLHAATGEIVAYTDDDCMPDPKWLQYLVATMQDQQVDAIGGPNLPPGSDSPVAQCVAASPGGPCHVMLDDRHAEHVPGCNMAFRREVLLALGGFDEQFRAAGDDVDICWRLIEAGKPIGFAPAALVWHHRRHSVRGYLRQQRGYGRAEALLQFKHPERFNSLGASRWRGVIYGEGAVGLPVVAPAVYHGRFGTGPFQIIYRRNHYTPWANVMLLEWHALALGITLGALAFHPPALVVAGVMWLLTLTAAARAAILAPLAQPARIWSRPLIFFLHLSQPIVRSWHRYWLRIRLKRIPDARLGCQQPDSLHSPRGTATIKDIGFATRDLYWASQNGAGREQLLSALERLARQEKWKGDFHAEWHAHDAELWPDPWHNVRIGTTTEELGLGKRFTRVRFTFRLTLLAKMTLSITALAGGYASISIGTPLGLLTLLPIVLLGSLMWIDRRRCRTAVTSLARDAGEAARLGELPS